MSVTIAPNVGSDVQRIDGVDKVTGTARYAFEHPIADAVYVAAVQSTIARGTIVEIDGARAMSEPGVLAVLDHTGVERLNAGEDTDPELLLLQSPEVAYRGQIVAAVAATTLEAAREAATLVQVQYDERPHDVLLRADHPELCVPESANAGVPGTSSRATSTPPGATLRSPSARPTPPPSTTTSRWSRTPRSPSGSTTG